MFMTCSSLMFWLWRHTTKHSWHNTAIQIPWLWQLISCLFVFFHMCPQNGWACMQHDWNDLLNFSLKHLPYNNFAISVKKKCCLNITKPFFLPQSSLTPLTRGVPAVDPPRDESKWRARISPWMAPWIVDSMQVYLNAYRVQIKQNDLYSNI